MPPLSQKRPYAEDYEESNDLDSPRKRARVSISHRRKLRPYSHILQAENSADISDYGDDFTNEVSRSNPELAQETHSRSEEEEGEEEENASDDGDDNGGTKRYWAAMVKEGKQVSNQLVVIDFRLCRSTELL